MSEHNWVTSGNPEVMLEFLRGDATERKLRLYACACCRALWPLVQGEKDVVEGLEVAERHADGEADEAALLRAHQRLREVRDRFYGIALIQGMGADQRDRFAALICAALACDPQAKQTVIALVERLPSWPPGLPSEQQVDLFREVFENPFRRASLPAELLSWQGGTVVNLAQAAYNDRELPAGTLDPARLCVLADALEDAGCADEAILSHLRSVGPHVRGCWVIDRILGKE